MINIYIYTYLIIFLTYIYVYYIHIYFHMSFFNIHKNVEASKLVDLLLLQFSLFRSETKSRQDIRRFHQFIRYFAHQTVHLGICVLQTGENRWC